MLALGCQKTNQLLKNLSISTEDKGRKPKDQELNLDIAPKLSKLDTKGFAVLVISKIDSFL